MSACCAMRVVTDTHTNGRTIRWTGDEKTISPIADVGCKNGVGLVCLNSVVWWTTAMLELRIPKPKASNTFHISKEQANIIVFSQLQLNYPWGIYDGITVLGSNFRLYLEATNRLYISCIMVPYKVC